jgi:hypothetical protein
MKFYSPSQISALADAEISYVIHGLERKDVGMLVAPSNAGKTTLVTNIAVAVASGTAFLPPLVEAGEPQTVLLLDYESTATRYDKNLAAAQSNLTADERQMVEKNLRVFLRKQDGGGHLSGDGGDFKELLQCVLNERPALVVVDLAVKAFHVSEENRNDRVIAEVMEPLARLAEEGNAAVLFTHHTNKGQAKQGEAGSRGAYAFECNAQAVYTLLRSGKHGPVTLSYAKIKGEVAPPFMEIVLDPETKKPVAAPPAPKGAAASTPLSLVASVGGPTAGVRAVVEALRKAGRPLNSGELETAVREPKKKGRKPVGRKEARAMIAAAVESGAINQSPGPKNSTLHSLPEWGDGEMPLAA